MLRTLETVETEENSDKNLVVNNFSLLVKISNTNQAKKCLGCSKQEKGTCFENMI